MLTQSLVSAGEGDDTSAIRYNAILMARSEIGDEAAATTVINAKHALELARQRDEFRIKNVGGERFVGNRPGLDLVELEKQFRELKKDLGQEIALRASQKEELDQAIALRDRKIALQKEELDQKIASQKEELGQEIASQKEELGQEIALRASWEELDQKIASQKEELGQEIALQKEEINILGDESLTMRTSSDEFMKVRGRFVTTFKRDKTGEIDDKDKEIIQDGNMIAHGADALADAFLYQPPWNRKDTDIFEMLYGLKPLEVLEIKCRRTIAALNTHAYLIASLCKQHLTASRNNASRSANNAASDTANDTPASPAMIRIDELTKRLTKQFTEFLRLLKLKDSERNTSYLGNGGPGVEESASAHEAFKKCAAEVAKASKLKI